MTLRSFKEGVAALETLRRGRVWVNWPTGFPALARLAPRRGRRRDGTDFTATEADAGRRRQRRARVRGADADALLAEIGRSRRTHLGKARPEHCRDRPTFSRPDFLQQVISTGR